MVLAAWPASAGGCSARVRLSPLPSRSSSSAEREGRPCRRKRLSTADRATGATARTGALLQALLAAALGVVLLFGVGFSHIEAFTTPRTIPGIPPAFPATDREARGVPVFRTIVFAAALAGLLAGLLLTVVQQLGTVPLILQAEVYEQRPRPAAATAMAGHDHAATSTRPGRRRTASSGPPSRRWPTS